MNIRVIPYVPTGIGVSRETAFLPKTGYARAIRTGQKKGGSASPTVALCERP